MIKFYLTTKKGEIINTTRSNNLEEAITYFATIKNINEEALILIYNVK